MDEQAAVEANAGIDRTLAEWDAALAAGDAALILSLVTDDAEFWRHGAAPLVGRAGGRWRFARGITNLGPPETAG